MTRGRNISGLAWGLIGGLVAGGVALVGLGPTLRRKTMTISNILKKDHRMVVGMIMTLEMTPKVNGMMRKSLFNRIRHQSLVHAQAEEEVFYPAVRNLGVGHAEQLVNDLYREHENIKNLLGQISNADPMSDEFDARVKDLKRTLQHHVEEEEGKALPMVERQMLQRQLEDLGQRFHNRKSDLRTRVAA